MAYQPKSYRKFLATSMTAAMVATAVAPITGLAASSFPDVAEGTPYTEPINALTKMGVLAGYPDGTFKLRNKVTRAEAAQVITQLRKLDTSASAAPFSDVKQGEWYSTGINAAYKAGIIVGKDNNKFEPNVQLTRAEFAQIVMMAYGIEPKKDAENKFTDVEDKWYKEAVLTLAADGVIAGKTATTFAPNEPIDRGDLAILAYTAEQKYGDGIVGDTQIKAVNNTTVEITYKEEVKDVKASDFEISGLKVENAAIKQSDSKTVVLTTAKQKGGEKYTVKQSGKEIGKFEGISAVIPEKIALAETAVQGVVGKQVTLKADVGVKEAGIPVTFNVQAQAGSLNKSHVEEALTNAEGIAEYSYTQYAAGYNDDVAVYPTGAPAQRAVAKVFWGVNEILKIEADDKLGDKLNNNEAKAYKITYNDPKTGKPAAGVTFQVTFAENVNVTVDKTSKATVNGVNPVQLTNNTTRTAEITTDGNGVAKFTVTGANTKVTPVVYRASENAKKLNDDNLRVYAKELQFGAIQSEYKITVTRDGGEKAATGEKNGRKYNVEVKDKDGKAVPNHVLNVGFMENLDRNVNTSTRAYFTKDEKKIDGSTTTIKLDKDGKASFTIASNDSTGNDYATPVVWYNIGNSNTGENSYHETSPQQKGAITYFESPAYGTTVLELRDTQDGSAYTGDKEKLAGNKTYYLAVRPGNQSGTTDGVRQNVEFGGTMYVKNTGTNTIKVANTTITPGSTAQLPVSQSDKDFAILSVDDKDASFEAYANISIPAKETNSNSATYLDNSKTIKGSFKSSIAMQNSDTVYINGIDISKEEFTTVNRSGKHSYEKATYRLKSNGSVQTKSNFTDAVEAAFKNNSLLEVIYETDKNGNITIYIGEETSVETKLGELIKASVKDKNLTALKVNETVSLPKSLANDVKLTWTSDDEGIVEVKNFEAKALETGDTVLKAKYEFKLNGKNVTDTVDVPVSVPATVDSNAEFTKLQSLIEKAELKLEGHTASEYVDGTYDALNAATKTAKKLTASSSVKDIKAAHDALEKALEATVTKTEAAKTALETVIKDAEGIDSKGYSNYNALKTAIDTAKDVLNDATKTEADFTQAAQTLQAAIDNLETPVTVVASGMNLTFTTTTDSLPVELTGVITKTGAASATIDEKAPDKNVIKVTPVTDEAQFVLEVTINGKPYSVTVNFDNTDLTVDPSTSVVITGKR